MPANTQHLIESIQNNPALLEQPSYQQAVCNVIQLLEKGALRVAQKNQDGFWITNAWVKQAILYYFKISPMQNIENAPFAYRDKINLKTAEQIKNIRVVPGAVAREGCYIAPSSILMPSFVNIGAYIDEGCMVDTWATVGSCAQIGKNVHLSGGVGIGGVLEPAQAQPVIVEDNAFIGSRCIIVEGAHIGEGAVLGSNVVITASTKIIDVSSEKEIVYTGMVPANSVVIPGTRLKKFPAGEYAITTPIIIGKRKKSTDLKTSLNDTLRDFEINV